MKFLAIAANNLDEFFMIRVATLTRQHRAGLSGRSPDGLTVEQQLEAVRARAERMLIAIASCWTDGLLPLLAAAGIHFLERAQYTPEVTAYLADYFRANVSPALTPLAFDRGHPFPYISNRSKSFAVVVEDQGTTKFARVKVPDVLPRFIPIPPSMSGRAGETFALLEDVVRLNLGELFPGVGIRSAHLFRIIRDTDIVLHDEEADDLLESVDQSLQGSPARPHHAARGRGRHARCVSGTSSSRTSSWTSRWWSPRGRVWPWPTGWRSCGFTGRT